MKKAIFLVILLVLISSIFYLFSYNSGYGYDPLEYLIIGRALLAGYPFYTFIPSKSWGFYYCVSLFLFLAKTGSHAAISFFITLIYACFLTGTFFFIKSMFNYRVALLSSLLIGIGANFMGMHFLICESLIYLFGLLGYYTINLALEKKKKGYLIIGGLLLGVAFSFKISAGTYILATIIFVIFWWRLKNNDHLVNATKTALLITGGALLVIVIPMCYFMLTGRDRDYFAWTYYYPLFKYHSNINWSHKLYTELLWFFVLIIAVLLLSMKNSIRRAIYSSPKNVYLLCMGAFSLLPLVKLQANHFVFPGGAFLLIYAAVVIDRAVYESPLKPKKKILILFLAGLPLLLMVSALLHRPAALKRLMYLDTYEREELLKQYIQAHAPQGRTALFFKNGIFLYWISNRYPNIPLIFSEPLATYCLTRQPQMLFDALRDPRLALVEFNPDNPGIVDRRFFATQANRELLQNFYGLLKENFVRLDGTPSPYVFWVRKGC